MRTRFKRIGALTAALLIVVAMAQERRDEAPTEIGLVERAERGLAQLDVTVRGPRAEIPILTAEDFELVVNARPIEELIVDRLCDDPELVAIEAPVAEPATTLGVAPIETVRPTSPKASYLFYFDQHHLTMEGRINSLENARLMMPDLVRGGNRATIVSSGEVLDTVVEMTDEVDVLLEGLDRLENDRKQWDIYPEQEALRIRDVLDKLRNAGQLAACGLARIYQQEESFRTDREMRSLSIVLGLLADVDPPKAVVYFADTVRKDSGKHYFSYVGCRGPSPESEAPAFGSEHALDRVVQEASANGIRLYTVQAQGLISGESSIVPAGHSRINAMRLRNAQDSLAGLALETGGQSFLNGVSAKKMAQAIQSDLECLYLISFDPGDLPFDAPLRVLLRSKRPRVKLQVRGQLVLQSESKKRTARLLSAFALAGSIETDISVAAVIVPTGFERGGYTALVQLATEGSPLSEAEWDLGASIVSRGEVKSDAAAHISVKQPGVPAIFEIEMHFKPGPFELIVVAHDSIADQLGTVRVSGRWPEKGEGHAVGPIAVLQPTNGVFLRDGTVRGTGSLGKGEQTALRGDLPTAIVGLVCRGTLKREKLRVERDLVGEGATEFPAIEIDDDERCIQIRDVIPERTMTSGSFSYAVRVLAGGREIAAGRREFIVAEEDNAGGRGSVRESPF